MQGDSGQFNWTPISNYDIHINQSFEVCWALLPQSVCVLGAKCIVVKVKIQLLLGQCIMWDIGTIVLKRQKQSQDIRSFFNNEDQLTRNQVSTLAKCTVYHSFSLMNFITELPELLSNTAVRLDSAELSTEPLNSGATTSTCSNIVSGHQSPQMTQTPSLLELAPFNVIGTILNHRSLLMIFVVQ